METKYKIKYHGVSAILIDCPGFSGRVLPGDVVNVFKSAIDELSGHDEWALLADKKEEKKQKTGVDE
jgi:hypothetical protein